MVEKETRKTERSRYSGVQWRHMLFAELKVGCMEEDPGRAHFEIETDK